MWIMWKYVNNLKVCESIWMYVKNIKVCEYSDNLSSIWKYVNKCQ